MVAEAVRAHVGLLDSFVREMGGDPIAGVPRDILLWMAAAWEDPDLLPPVTGVRNDSPAASALNYSLYWARACEQGVEAADMPESVSMEAPEDDLDPLAMWDDNGNGRISCAEARNHGIAPVRRDHPAYQYMRDSNSDGIVCEP